MIKNKFICILYYDTFDDIFYFMKSYWWILCILFVFMLQTTVSVPFFSRPLVYGQWEEVAIQETVSEPNIPTTPPIEEGTPNWEENIPTEDNPTPTQEITEDGGEPTLADSTSETAPLEEPTTVWWEVPSVQEENFIPQDPDQFPEINPDEQDGDQLVITIYEYEEMSVPSADQVVLSSSDALLPEVVWEEDYTGEQTVLSGGVALIALDTVYEISESLESSGANDTTTWAIYTGRMTIMSLSWTTIYFPEQTEITKADMTKVNPQDLTIVPQEAVTQLPIKEITVVDRVSLTLADAWVETAQTYDLSWSTDTPKKPLQEIFEFGIVGEHLIFSAPVEIQQAVPYPDGSLVEINVYHANDTDWTTTALAVDPTTCTNNGEATNSSFLAEVYSGIVRFFTCGASTFSVTYTWWASAPNFVDNATKDFTVTVTTGSSFPTGSVLQDANVLIDFRPIDNESPTGPWWVTNCYPREKSFLLIHPDGTSVQLANAGTYTAPNTNCPQAQIYYDQSAAGGIVWWAWNLTWQSRQPVGNLSTLNGKSPFGTWTVRMGDNAWQDWVIMFGFELDLQNVECGDGIITSPEVCDDNNTDNDDGCSALCSVEAWWECTGAPSVCTLIPTPSGLLLHYDGSYAWGLFTDISWNGFNGTQFNGVTTGNQNGETTMCFNGSTQYIQRATNLVTAYPFTMSTWVKSNSTAITAGMMSFARSSSTNRMRNIEHTNTTIRQNAQNTAATYTNASTALNTTQWFLVTAVYSSATSRTIYVNGVSAGTNTTNVTYSSNNNNRLNIWRFADSSPSNYFNGCVDDVRFYSSALTSWQVYTLYAKPAALTTSLVTVWSPQLTGTIVWTLDTITLTISGTVYTGTNLWNGTWNLSGWVISPELPNGTYPVTLTVTNPYWRSVQYTSAFTVDIPVDVGDYCIAWPSSISFPQITTDSSAQTWFTSSSGYFELIDSSGADSGYYTTLQITNLSGSSETILNSWIARQSTGITLLSGTANTGVVLWSAFASYSVATWTVTFIKRDPAANSWKIWTYGAILDLRLSLPAYIKPDTYTGTITYTLYEN